MVVEVDVVLVLLIITFDNPLMPVIVAPSGTVVLPNVTCPDAHVGAYPAPADCKNVPMAPAVINVVKLTSD